MKSLPLAYRQVHLDFHTSAQIPGVGSRFDPGKFVRVLQEARVNSITCFSKCHHGMIYHDTRFPARHPHLERNLLAEQIEACHAAGIRVPVYISVGWDEFMAAEHPEWLEVAADGSLRGAPFEAGWKKLCLNSPYIDYVSEQTAEVLSLFSVDGLFFDIIHQRGCCCPRCIRGMIDGGLDPTNAADRVRFSREVLDQVRRRLHDEIKSSTPDCLIFWNSGHIGPEIHPVLDTYTHLELESLPTGGWGYDHFPLTVRYARNLGLQYLGMTGKFQKTWAGFGEYRNRVALEFDCFTALAEGGRCSIGDQLHPRGDLSPTTYDLIGHVYRQVEAREEWCEESEPLAEIAIFNPEAIGAADGRVDSSAAGALRILMESHLQCNVVDAEMDWTRYRLLILPDKIRLDSTLTAHLAAYVASGGSILATGQSGLAQDRDEFVLPELGARLRGWSPFEPEYVVAGVCLTPEAPEGEHVIYSRGLQIDPAPEAERLAEVWQPYFNRAWDHFCSHRHTPVDRPSGFPAAIQTGRCIYFCHPLFQEYLRHGLPICRQLIRAALRRLLPPDQRLLLTNLPSTARVSLMRQPASDTRDERLIAHLLHYVPEARFREIHTVEEAIPLHDIELDLRVHCPPGRVYLAPAGEDLQYDCGQGRTRVTVPRFAGHAMVVLEGVQTGLPRV